MTHPSVLADAVREAAEMLDREEHRYVERFIACPNGCEYVHRGQTSTRTAGPVDCHDCFLGSAEDEDAPQINPLLALLAQAADLIDMHLQVSS